MKMARWACPVLFLCAALGNAVSADDPETASTWIRYFEGPQYGALFDVIQADDGAILAVGTTCYAQDSMTVGDVLIMKADLDGEPIWETTHGGSAFDVAICVEAVESGFLVLGETDSFGAGKRDLYLLKLDHSGALEWSRTYGGSGVEWAKALVARSDGTFLLVGASNSFGSGDFDIYAVAVDEDGNEIWSRTLGEAETQESGTSALETDDGSLLILAVVSYAGSHRDTRLYRLDSLGNEMRSSLLTGDMRQSANAMTVAADGDIVITGMSEEYGSSPGPTDFWMAKVDAATGKLRWSVREVNQVCDDYGLALTRTSAGSSYLAAGMGPGFPLVRFDEDGTVQWLRTLADERVHGGFAVLELPDGTFIIPGFVYVGGAMDGFDAVLVRVNAEGQVE